MYGTLPNAIVLTAVMALGFSAGADRVVQRTRLRIGLVTPAAATSSPPSAAAARGIRLGAAEARQTARLFGDDVELYEASGSGARGVMAAAKQLASARHVQVLIGTSAGDADLLSSFAEARGIIFFNVASRAWSLRAACLRHTFHIEGSDGMYANALRFAERHPATSPRASSARARMGRDSLLLWSPTLTRFGAAQINDRYQAQNRVPMDGSAWAGWAAVKIASEAALRARSTESSTLIAYLESPAAQFDGHKGWPLSFRTVDHQLRQPLYVMNRSGATGPQGQAVADVPELRAVSAQDTDGGTRGPDASAALDEVIGSPSPPCRWSKRG
jgi:hypothetical protein